MLQKFHWTWLCEHDDNRMNLTLRVVNAINSTIIWMTWLGFPSKAAFAPGIAMDIVQVSLQQLFYVQQS